MKEIYFKEKIKTYFDIEYGIMGENTVNSIIENKINNKKLTFFESKEGSNLDFTIIITTLTTIVSVIELCLKIIELKNKKRDKIEPEKIVIEILNHSKLSIEEKKLLSQDSRFQECINDIISEKINK